MQIRAATRQDTRAIAELTLIAGEGIPAYFWAQVQRAEESIIDVGARCALSESENFSYRNAQLALLDGEVAGIMLGYRLPSGEAAEELSLYPEFIRPLIELEQCVPDSYYVNMLATYPQFRNRGVGTSLMAVVDGLAGHAGCTLSSVAVFEENRTAHRLYERIGYGVIATRPMIAHPCHPYRGEVLLLARDVMSG